MRKAFFWWAVPLTVAAQSWEVLDYHLVPRFLFLAFGLLLFGGLMMMPKSKPLPAKGSKGSVPKLEEQAPDDGVAWQLLDVLLLSYAAWNFFSIAYSHLKGEAVFETLKILMLLCVFRMTKAILMKEKEGAERTLLLANAAATVLVLSSTFYQLFNLCEGDPIGFVGNPDKTYLLTGLSAHRNLNAGYLLMLLPLNVVALLRNKGALKAALGVLLGIQLLALKMLDSDSVALAIVAGLVTAQLLWFVGHVKSGFKPFSLPSMGMALLVLGMAGAFVTGAFEKASVKLRESDTGRERLFLWHRTVESFKDRSLIGVGNGNWQIFFPSKSVSGSYRLQDLEVYATRPHNDFLWIWAELGWIGLLMWLALLLSACAAGLVAAFQKGDSPSRWAILWPLCGLVGWAVFSFFDFPRERIEHQALLGVLLGWLAYQAEPILKRTVNVGLPAKPLNILAGLLLVLALYVGYVRCMGEFYMRGTLYAKNTGQWKEVWRLAELAKSPPFYVIDPTTFPIAWYEGMGHYFSGDKVGSYKKFEEAYSIHPYNAHVVNNLGTSLLEQARDQEARDLYEGAVAINPNFEDGKRNLVVVCANLKDFEAAHKWLATIKGDSATINRYTRFLQEKERK